MFDCHLHFDADLVDLDGLIASMDTHGIQRAALIAPICPDLAPTLMISYGGAPLRRLLNSPIAPLRRAIRGLYHSWVLKDGMVEVGGKRYPVTIRPDNEPIRQAVLARPKRLVGWIFVNPNGPVNAVEELEKYIDTPGMIGLKSHAYWHNYPLTALDDAAALCEERGLPLLIHLGTGPNGDYKHLPTRFPRLRIIYAHAGVPYQRSICDYARVTPNVYIDLSSPGYVDARVAREAVRRAGVENCFYGSDGPYLHHANNRIDFAPNLRILESLRLRDAERQRIAHSNFLGLISRPPADPLPESA